MNTAERARTRALLTHGISVTRLIDDLERARYGDLVLEHMRKGGKQLSVTILDHEQAIEPHEQAACNTMVSGILAQASSKEFWGKSAGDVLNLLSCNLHDELFPYQPDDAFIFIAFQIATLRLSIRAADSPALREMIASTPLAAPKRGASGTVTKMIGIAICDFDAGRLSRKNLVLILQDAIDNGDILEPLNEEYVVTHVIPLIDAGTLTRSPAVDNFEKRIIQRAIHCLPWEGSIVALLPETMTIRSVIHTLVDTYDINNLDAHIDTIHGLLSSNNCPKQLHKTADKFGRVSWYFFGLYASRVASLSPSQFVQFVKQQFLSYCVEIGKGELAVQLIDTQWDLIARLHLLYLTMAVVDHEETRRELGFEMTPRRRIRVSSNSIARLVSRLL